MDPIYSKNDTFCYMRRSLAHNGPIAPLFSAFLDGSNSIVDRMRHRALGPFMLGQLDRLPAFNADASDGSYNNGRADRERLEQAARLRKLRRLRQREAALVRVELLRRRQPWKRCLRAVCAQEGEHGVAGHAREDGAVDGRRDHVEVCTKIRRRVSGGKT